MRCKVGDLAVIVRAAIPENVGRLVTVLGPRGFEPEAWETEIVGTAAPAKNLFTGVTAPRKRGWTYDRNLRPIRDNDGEDEMLRIAGKPHEVTA